MELVIGKWRIKGREKPLGGKAILLLLHFGGTELILTLAVVITIFMQFRKRVLAIVSRLIPEITGECVEVCCLNVRFSRFSDQAGVEKLRVG